MGEPVDPFRWLKKPPALPFAAFQQADGIAFIAAFALVTGLLEESSPVRSVCLVGSSEDKLRLRLRLSSVPGHARPSTGGAFALRLVVIGRDVSFG
jgi:hypothetical protein